MEPGGSEEARKAAKRAYAARLYADPHFRAKRQEQMRAYSHHRYHSDVVYRELQKERALARWHDSPLDRALLNFCQRLV